MNMKELTYTPDEIEVKLDELFKAIVERTKHIDVITLSYQPNFMYWATTDERTEIHRLKMLLPALGILQIQATERIRLRVLKRRKS